MYNKANCIRHIPALHHSASSARSPSVLSPRHLDNRKPLKVPDSRAKQTFARWFYAKYLYSVQRRSGKETEDKKTQKMKTKIIFHVYHEHTMQNGMTRCRVCWCNSYMFLKLKIFTLWLKRRVQIVMLLWLYPRKLSHIRLDKCSRGKMLLKFCLLLSLMLTMLCILCWRENF